MENPERVKRDLSGLRIDREEREEESGRRGLRAVAVTTLLLVAVAGSIVAYRVWGVSLRFPEVEVSRAIVESGTMGDEILTATGYIVAHRKAAVSPKISGRLEFLGVDVDSRVKSGQVVARLEHNDLDAQLEDAKALLGNGQASLGQAQASLAQSEATLAENQAVERQTGLELDRQQNLFKTGVTSKATVDNAEASSKVARAQVRAAEAQIRSSQSQINSAEALIRSAEARIRVIEAQLEYSNIRAPFDGLVISKDAEIGETVAPAIFGGTSTRGSVITIIDPGSLEVEADVNESNIGKVFNGLPAQILLDALPDKKFNGEVRQVVPTADRQKATVKVKVKFLDPDPRILPDMSAKVTFIKKAATPAEADVSRIKVPKSALQQRDGQTTVLVLSGDLVHIQPVQTGSESAEMVEIKQGLAGGETLIIRGGDSLNEGARVKVK